MTPQGKVTGRFEVPEGGLDVPGLGAPDGLIAGPDGNLWFHAASGSIGRISLDGKITEFDMPQGVGADGGLAIGPDGALWFADLDGNHIGRLT
jgi:virginiamycin B lyase